VKIQKMLLRPSLETHQQQLGNSVFLVVFLLLVAT